MSFQEKSYSMVLAASRAAEAYNRVIDAYEEEGERPAVETARDLLEPEGFLESIVRMLGQDSVEIGAELALEDISRVEYGEAEQDDLVERQWDDLLNGSEY